MNVSPFLLEGVLQPGVSSGHRTPGLHMSDIYNDYYQEKEPKRYDKTKPMNMLRLEAGLILEQAVEEGLQARFGVMLGGERPGEFTTKEGIIYTPDLIVFRGRDTVLGEIKLTWMSARDCPISPAQSKETGLPSNWDGVSSFEFDKKFDKYFCQMKCYCYHLRTPFGRLIVYFVNGDMHPPAPVLLGWDFVFSEIELAETWATQRNHARHRKLLP